MLDQMTSKGFLLPNLFYDYSLKSMFGCSVLEDTSGTGF